MRDRLSKQEKEAMELYEKQDAITVFEVPPPIIARLLQRELLERRSEFDGRAWDHIAITERGLTALRGGEWPPKEEKT